MTKIRRFFAAYAQGVNNFDPDLVSTQFLDSFMGAGPGGVACYRNDATLRAALKQRRSLFEQMGFKFAEALNIAENPIDEHYTMAKVHWRMVFEKQAGQPQEFKFFVTYFLFDSPDGLRIAFYISREDEQKVLRDAGLLPRQPEPWESRHVTLH